MSGRGVVLFTRDLRVHDNPALDAAASTCDEVVPVFVSDPRLHRGGAEVRQRFLLGSLVDLDRSLQELGAGLAVRGGDPVEEVMRLAAETGATAIHTAEDVSGYAQRRLERLRRACSDARIELAVHPGVTVAPPGDLAPAGSDCYRVFTPYWRRWLAAPLRAELPVPERLAGVRVNGLTLPTVASLGGERGGLARLDAWLPSGLRAGEPSRLGAHLHFGCVSPLAAARRARSLPGGEAFLRNLCWRDFFHQLLAARPDLAKADLRPRRTWLRDGAALAAWQEGRTGYPYVDAAMRQLATEGWIDNRARLVVASFLTKHLSLDWRLGAAHFMATLVDGDVASNAGNWQWAAGTGTDTRPRRFLNPILQARRHDPSGDYVRRWVPELAVLRGAAVHEPWRADAAGRRGYPGPIIDHDEARARFLGEPIRAWRRRARRA